MQSKGLLLQSKGVATNCFLLHAHISLTDELDLREVAKKFIKEVL